MPQARRIARPVGAASLVIAIVLILAAPLLSTPRSASALTAPHIAADPPPVAPAVEADFDLLNGIGHFYTQTGGTLDGSTGFAVTNEGGVPFWTAFRNLGGVTELGYPASTRFTWRDSLVQVMQRNVLVWDAGNQQVTLGNTFDLLHDLGFDQWLEDTKKVPPPFSTATDTGRPWDEVVANHLALLSIDPDIRARYFTNSNPIDHYGLPMGYRDYAEVLVVRMQRVVFQKWKIPTSFAQPGDITIANGGDVAKEAGVFSQAALVPQPSPFEQGEASTVPWSGWWWPSHPNGGEPQLWEQGGPYWKYDRYVESLGESNPDVTGWERANQRYFGRDEDWAGHCNGWAAAAILEPEPTRPVTRNGITFTVGDQKGLLSGYHFADEAAWVVGGRPNGVSPIEFRTALRTWLSGRHKAFLANIYSKPTQVWSAPAYKYETLYGPDPDRPGVNHFRTKVWYADYHVAPNFVGSQVFGGEPKIYEYYLEGPVDRPTGGGWEGVSAGNSEFARPFHLWYPDPNTRNGQRWTPALRYDIIKQIVPGAGSAPAAFDEAVGMLGFRAPGGAGALLPNNFWMPNR